MGAKRKLNQGQKSDTNAEQGFVLSIADEDRFSAVESAKHAELPDIQRGCGEVV